MNSKPVAIALAACALTFALFAGNVLYGRFAPVFDWDATLRLARVPEFLLLFASAVFFVVAALAAERRARASRSLDNSGETE